MRRLLSIGLFLTPLICYLEWGRGQTSFLFQVEYSLLFNSSSTLKTFFHPLVLLPMLGQLLVIIAIFQTSPGRRLIVSGQLLLSVLVLLVLTTGLLKFNWKIVASTLPFILVSVAFYRAFKKE
jgi:hypothetical protein